MKKTVITAAPGKVNLSLDITGVQSNGYHKVDMVLQAIDLCDTVTLSRMSGSGIFISCDRPRIPCDETNLAHIAARKFFKAFGIPEAGLMLDIQKRLPSQAGLGGGSADAAGVLAGMNVLFDVNAPLASLCEIGAAVGADVPFCLTGGICRARGIGEQLTPLTPLPKCYLLIAKPVEDISTPESYRRYDQIGAQRRPVPEEIVRLLAAEDLRGLGAAMYNVLEEVAEVAEVAFLRQKLLDGGALGAMMSGSGSAVFGIFDNLSLAKHCMRKLYGHAQSVFLTRPTPFGASVITVREG